MNRSLRGKSAQRSVFFSVPAFDTKPGLVSESPALEQEPSAGEVDRFELEADRPAELSVADRERLATRGRYSKTLAEISEELGRLATGFGIEWRPGVGTIKRWIRIGREVPPADGGPDFPPLEDPARLASWWERRMKWKVPEVLSRLREETSEGADSETSKESAGGDVTPPGERAAAAFSGLSRAKESLSGVERGFAAALERCEEAEALAYARWQEELNRPQEEFDPRAEKDRREAHDKALTKLRQMQAGAAKILDESADFARLVQVDEIVAMKAANLRAGLVSIMQRIGSKVRIEPGLFERLCKLYDRELDEAFRVMGEGGYAAPFALAGEDD